MPTQILKGHTFRDGDTGVSAATLNSIVDSATLLPGAITEQAQVVPAVTDSFLYSKGTGGLRKCTLQDILNAVPSNQPGNIASLRKLGTGATMAAAGNDSRFPSTFTGVRMANGTAPDTVAKPSDIVTAPKILAANEAIDWNAFNVFTRDMAGNESYTFQRVKLGQTITIIFKLHGHTPTLNDNPSVYTAGTGTTFKCYRLTNTALGTIGTAYLI